MPQNKLQKTSTIILKSILVVLSIVLIIIILSLLSTLNNRQSNNSSSSNTPNSQIFNTSPQPTSLASTSQLQRAVTAEWQTTNTISYSLGNNTSLRVPNGFNRITRSDNTDLIPGGLSFIKKVDESTNQYLQIETNKNGAKQTLEEFVNSKLNRWSNDIKDTYILKTEILKGYYSSTIEYQQKNYPLYALKTLIYAKPYFHEISVYQTLPEGASLSDTSSILYTVRSNLLEAYEFNNIDLDINSLNNDTEEIKVEKANRIYYENNK